MVKKQLTEGFKNLKIGVNYLCLVGFTLFTISTLCVTAHYANHNLWQMIKRTIALDNLGYPHNIKYFS